MSRMPWCWAAAARLACRRRRSSGCPGRPAAGPGAGHRWSRVAPFVAFWFGAPAGPPEGGDAVGGGPSDGVRGAADDGGDLGVGQACQVVVGDGLFLLGGSRATASVRSPSAGVIAVSFGGCVSSGVCATGTARRAAARMTSMALRWAIVTSHASTFALGGRSGYALIAARNVSDHASSASTGPSTARQTRSTVAPCSVTTASNGCFPSCVVDVPVPGVREVMATVRR